MTVAKFTDVSGEVRLIGELTGATLAEATPQWTTVTLTSAQLLAAETTAVTLIAAPGSGKLLNPLSLVLHYRPGATPYVGDGAKFAVGFGTTLASIGTDNALWTLGTPNPVGFATPDFFLQAAAAYARGNALDLTGAWVTTSVVDKQLAACFNDGVGLSGGDGTLTVSTLCSVLDTTVTS